MQTWVKCIVTMICVLVISSASAQATLIVGAPADPGTGNAFPFGSGIAAYQQVYASSDFSGPFSISGLTFYNTAFSPGFIDTANYNVQLSTTSAPVTGLSNTFAANYGADNTTVFNGTLSGAASPSFTIPTSLFNYNPTNGNLLLTVFVTNASGPNGNLYNDARLGTAPGIFSRKYSVFSTTTADAGDNNYGLVTGFETTQATSPVPEPASIGMALTGVALGLGYCRRNRKRSTV